MKQNQSQLPSLRLICIFQHKKKQEFKVKFQRNSNPNQRHFLENHTNRNGKSNLLSIGNKKTKQILKR